MPSATETTVALGVRPVGCTRFCDLDGVAVVGGTKRVDVDAVVALRPDVVIVNDEENRLEDAEALAARGVRLHAMSPRSVADVGDAVRALAGVLGVGAPPPFGAWDAWCASTVRTTRRRAFVAVWRRPWMSLAADTYGSSLLAHIGVANVFADAPDRYPEVGVEEIVARAPEIVLLPSEPYPFRAAHVAAVRDELGGIGVELVDGRDLFWWGARTPLAAARLAERV